MQQCFSSSGLSGGCGPGWIIQQAEQALAWSLAILGAPKFFKILYI